MSLSWTVNEINPGSKTYIVEQRANAFIPQEQADLNKLDLYIHAGGHFRCPSCLSWYGKKQLGGIGSHQLKTPAGRLVRYVTVAVCKRCQKKSLHDSVSMQALIDRIASYCNDQYVEVAK